MDLTRHRESGTFSPVSVIICAYTEQRWNELEKAIHAVSTQTPAPGEIILVIDHHQELLERAQKAFPQARVIPNSEQRGLSGARNSGVKAASEEILVFLDEDAWPEPGWLAQLLFAYASPEVLGAGGMIEPEWASGRPGWFPEEFDWVVGCTYRGMPVRATPVRNLIGANMSFRRSAFTAVGGFNHGIGRVGSHPAGGEETEFSIRLRQQMPGGVLLHLPEARVHHLVPSNRSRWKYFASRCYREGQSKALVTRLVGSQDGLDSERSYTLHTLPNGVLQAIQQALRGDPYGLPRALAIVAGLALTAAGYLVGKVRLEKAGHVPEEQTPLEQTIQKEPEPMESTLQQGLSGQAMVPPTGEENTISERIGGK